MLGYTCINTLISVSCPSIRKSTLISCLSTCQCCQLTAFTKDFASSLHLLLQLLQWSHWKETGKKLQQRKPTEPYIFFSVLAGCGESWKPDAKRPENPFRFRERLVNKHLQYLPLSKYALGERYSTSLLKFNIDNTNFKNHCWFVHLPETAQEAGQMRVCWSTVLPHLSAGSSW